MSYENNDFSKALDEAILEYTGEVVPEPGRFREVFQSVNENYPKESWTASGATFGEGMQKIGRGEATPETKGHERATATINLYRYSSSKGWNIKTKEQFELMRGDILDFVKYVSAENEISKDTAAAEVLTSTSTGYDGKALFATDHPVDSSAATGSVSNISTTGTGVTYDTIVAAMVVLQDSINANEDGKKFTNTADTMIVTNTTDQLNAAAVLTPIGKAGVATNDANPLPALRVILWPTAYLSTATSYWYLMNSRGVAGRGLRFLGQTGGLLIESEKLIRTQGYASYANSYFGAGYDEWRHIVRHVNA